MDLGTWDVKINTSSVPQSVASTFEELNNMVGVRYEFIAYIGSQIVNGVNHAILAEQTLFAIDKTKNIVVVIFNEKDPSEPATIVSIERIIEGGLTLGGIDIDVKIDIPEEAREVLNECFEAYVGADVEPIALLGTSVTKGTNYVFAATLVDINPHGKDDAVIIIANSMTKRATISDMLSNKVDSGFSYAFSW